MQKFFRFITATAYYFFGYAILYTLAFAIFGTITYGGPLKGGLLINFGIILGSIWLLRYLRRKYWLSRRKD